MSYAHVRHLDVLLSLLTKLNIKHVHEQVPAEHAHLETMYGDDGTPFIPTDLVTVNNSIFYFHGNQLLGVLYDNTGVFRTADDFNL